jgi:hypothetical protein
MLGKYDELNHNGQKPRQVETFVVDAGEGNIWKLSWHRRQVVCRAIGRFQVAPGNNEFYSGYPGYTKGYFHYGLVPN